MYCNLDFQPQWNVHMAAIEEFAITISWSDAFLANISDACDFKEYLVQVKPEAAASESWSKSYTCEDPTNRTYTSCRVQGLTRNAPYDLRVKATCQDADDESLWGYVPMAVWTLPASFESRMGVSLVNPIMVHMSPRPFTCQVINECCTDTFSTCIGDPQIVTDGMAVCKWRQCNPSCGGGVCTSRSNFLDVDCDVAVTAGQSGWCDCDGDDEMDTWETYQDCDFPGGTCTSICETKLGEQVRITRIDGPQNWGQSPTLQCKQQSYSICGGAIPQPAEAPLMVRSWEPTDNAAQIQWKLGQMNECNCPAVNVQLRKEGDLLADGTYNWYKLGGDCADLTKQGCNPTNLDQDTLFFARVQVTCSNSSLNSEFTYAPKPFRTLPQCPWVESSGIPGMFQCKSGMVCTANYDACCNIHGGRLRCPPMLRHMCSDSTSCADGQDHCCMMFAAQCEPYGGVRPCAPRPREPADTPTNVGITDFEFAGQVSLFRRLAGFSTRRLTDFSQQEVFVDLHWTPGTDPHECEFFKWEVNFKPNRQFWVAEDLCTGLFVRGFPSTCKVSGLSSGVSYSFRVRELCYDELAASQWLESSEIIVNEPGVWEGYMGPLREEEVEKPTDVLMTPYRCGAIQTEGDLDEFSVCYNQVLEPVSQHLSVFRTDVPQGWGADLWLRCVAKGFEHMWVEEPATDPDYIYFKADRARMHTQKLMFTLGKDVGTCTCANVGMQIFPEQPVDPAWPSHPLTLQPGHPDSQWLDVADECNDIANRECTANRPERLWPNTWYSARVRITCIDDKLSSNYTLSPEPAATMPGCHWSIHSFRVGEFLCEDGSMCGRSPDEVEDGIEPRKSQCCDELFGVGRLRCPWEAPVMCENLGTYSAGRECAVNETACAPFGGVRACIPEQVPAETPTITRFWTWRPSTLALSWIPGVYKAQAMVDAIDGTVRAGYCDFQKWHIEALRVTDDKSVSSIFERRNLTDLFSPNNGPVWGRDRWRDPHQELASSITFDKPFLNCDIYDRNTKECLIEGLEGNIAYYLRLTEICQNPDHNSMMVATNFPMYTHPVAADPPPWVTCNTTSFQTLETAWGEGSGNNCSFMQWDLELQLQERPEGVSDYGRYESYLPASPWIVMSQINYSHSNPNLTDQITPIETWEAMNPNGTYGSNLGSDQFFKDGQLPDMLYPFSGLIPGRHYKVRVRERCSDIRADSPYTISESACLTDSLPAQMPINFRAFDPSQYTFELEWTSRYPGACIFHAWEVHVKPYGEEWPEDANTTYGCWVRNRLHTFCQVDVGVESGTRWTVRMRETCTDPQFNSPWSDLPPPGVTTLMPKPADKVENVTWELLSMQSMRVDWSKGTERGNCYFAGWLVEVALRTGQPLDPLTGLRVEPGWQTVDPYTWYERVDCGLPRTLDDTSCVIFFDLWATPDATYDLNVRETCTDPKAFSLDVIHERIIYRAPSAGAPLKLDVVKAEVDLFDLAWKPGAVSGEGNPDNYSTRMDSPCQVWAWRVELRKHALRSSGGKDDNIGWHDYKPCTGQFETGALSYCKITGLQSNEGHEVRLREACYSPLTVGHFVYPQYPIWTLPGEWEFFVEATASGNAEIDTLSAAHRCAMVDRGTHYNDSLLDSGASFCYERGSAYSRFGGTALVQSRNYDGWSEPFQVRCLAASMERQLWFPDAEAPTDTSAWISSLDTRSFPLTKPSDGEVIEISDTTESTMKVQFRAGKSLGSCTCASPRVQLNRIPSPDPVTANWVPALGSCADVTRAPYPLLSYRAGTPRWFTGVAGDHADLLEAVGGKHLSAGRLLNTSALSIAFTITWDGRNQEGSHLVRFEVTNPDNINLTASISVSNVVPKGSTTNTGDLAFTVLPELLTTMMMPNMEGNATTTTTTTQTPWVFYLPFAMVPEVTYRFLFTFNVRGDASVIRNGTILGSKTGVQPILAKKLASEPYACRGAL
jgi:hypothetical protein